MRIDNILTFNPGLFLRMSISFPLKNAFICGHLSRLRAPQTHIQIVETSSLVIGGSHIYPARVTLGEKRGVKAKLPTGLEHQKFNNLYTVSLPRSLRLFTPGKMF